MPLVTKRVYVFRQVLRLFAVTLPVLAVIGPAAAVVWYAWKGATWAIVAWAAWLGWRAVVRYRRAFCVPEGESLRTRLWEATVLTGASLWLFDLLIFTSPLIWVWVGFIVINLGYYFSRRQRVADEKWAKVVQEIS